MLLLVLKCNCKDLLQNCMMVIRKIFLRSANKFSKSEILAKGVAKMLSKLLAKFKMKFADRCAARSYILITHSSFEVCAYVICKWRYAEVTSK